MNSNKSVTASAKSRMPELVIGTSSLGNLFVAIDDATKRDIVRSWLDALPKPVAIDSAGKYGAGLSLEVIGRELAAAGVDPADVRISNKLGWLRSPLKTPEPTFEPGVWKNLKHDAVQDISGPGIRRCWEEGNELLGDYKPSFLSVHDPDEYLAAASGADDRQRRLDQIIEAYQELESIRDSGGCLGIGVGCKDWRIVQELDQLVSFDWVMIANSLTIMSHPSELLQFLDALAQKHVHVINSAVLHGGFLVGGEFCDYKLIDSANPEDAAKLAWRDQFRSICEQHAVKPFQAAVSFGLAPRSIGSIALSSSNPQRTGSMLDAVQAKFPNDFWNSLLEAKLIRNEPAILGELLP